MKVSSPEELKGRVTGRKPVHRRGSVILGELFLQSVLSDHVTIHRQISLVLLVHS